MRWLDEAIDDLVEHVEYVARESPRAARHIAARIRSAGEELGDFAIGRPGQVPQTYERVLADLPYTIVYSLESRTISILRVIHHAQRWPRSPEDQ